MLNATQTTSPNRSWEIDSPPPGGGVEGRNESILSVPSGQDCECSEPAIAGAR